MRKLALAVLVLAFCSTGWAQRNSPGEIYLGYSLLDGDTLSKASGFEVTLMGNVSDWLGLKADLSGNYRSDGPVHAHELNVLFGPQVSDHMDRLTVFAHGLIGIAHFGGNVASDTGGAWVLGGGADYDLNRSFAVRVAQLDYHGGHVFSTSQTDFRFSAGLIFRFR